MYVLDQGVYVLISETTFSYGTIRNICQENNSFFECSIKYLLGQVNNREYPIILAIPSWLEREEQEPLVFSEFNIVTYLNSSYKLCCTWVQVLSTPTIIKYKNELQVQIFCQKCDITQYVWISSR